jgi:two-component system invasion response regulator UvrY
MSVPVKVVVVDDTDHVREMLTSMLSLDGFNVVAQARSGEDALEKVKDSRPDVVVMDYSMPDMDGLEATRQIRAAIPKQSVILYTAYVDDALKKAASDAGAALVVGKVEGLETLERSISELCLQLSGE